MPVARPHHNDWILFRVEGFFQLRQGLIDDLLLVLVPRHPEAGRETILTPRRLLQPGE